MLKKKVTTVALLTVAALAGYAYNHKKEAKEMASTVYKGIKSDCKVLLGKTEKAASDFINNPVEVSKKAVSAVSKKVESFNLDTAKDKFDSTVKSFKKTVNKLKK